MNQHYSTYRSALLVVEKLSKNSAKWRAIYDYLLSFLSYQASILTNRFAKDKITDDMVEKYLEENILTLI